MPRIHARVTIELDVTDEEFHRIMEDCTTADGSMVCDYDLSEEEVARFIKYGKVAEGWDDPGYIPDNWLTFDAVDSGLYEWADDDTLCRKEG